MPDLMGAVLPSLLLTIRSVPRLHTAVGDSLTSTERKATTTYGGEVFERFTNRSRRVLVLAQEEARVISADRAIHEHGESWRIPRWLAGWLAGGLGHGYFHYLLTDLSTS